MKRSSAVAWLSFMVYILILNRDKIQSLLRVLLLVFSCLSPRVFVLCLRSLETLSHNCSTRGTMLILIYVANLAV